MVSFFGELNDNNELVLCPYQIIQELNKNISLFHQQNITFVIDKTFMPEFNKRYNSYFVKIKEIHAYDESYKVEGYIYIHDTKTRVFNNEIHNKIVYKSKYDLFRDENGVMIKFYPYYYE